MTLQKSLDNWLMLQKQLPPRPGLVPQSGDPQHPVKWIRPAKEDYKTQHLKRVHLQHTHPSGKSHNHLVRREEPTHYHGNFLDTYHHVLSSTQNMSEKNPQRQQKQLSLTRQSKYILSGHKPKMKNVRGQTWDSIPVYLPDGKKIDGYVDTTWGKYIYFQHGDRWYKTDTGNAEYGRWAVDFRPK